MGIHTQGPDWPNKGDLLAGTGSNVVSNVAVGSNNQVLTADSTQTNGIKWATLTTLSVAKTLFNHYADANNSGTGETDLYSDTLAAGQLTADGDKIVAQYGGIFTGAATATQELRAYFGGTLIFDSGALGIGVATDSWNLDIVIVRASSSAVRCSASLTTNFATLSSYATYTTVSGLTLANTQIVKTTGQAAGAAGASNQITAKEGYLEYKPA